MFQSVQVAVLACSLCAVAAQNIGTIAGALITNGMDSRNTSLYPLGLSIDYWGNLFVVSGNQLLMVGSNRLLTVVAGAPKPGISGNGGPAETAFLNTPHGVSVYSGAPPGNRYIADTLNHRICVVWAENGTITTIAGTGNPGFSGDGGPATNADLNLPYDVQADANGNIYIADTFNNRIRVVWAASGVIQSIVGNGSALYSGDGGPALQASLDHPYNVQLDAQSNILIADNGNNVIRKVWAATGTITTIAGTGVKGYNADGIPATAAQFNSPSAVHVDAKNNTYVADTGNHRIRIIWAVNGSIDTIAGTGGFGYSCDDVPATNSTLFFPSDLQLDAENNMYIADTHNNRLRKVWASNNTITTVMGGVTANNIQATAAALFGPRGIHVDAANNRYIADTYNNLIRVVWAATGTIATLAGSGIAGYGGDGFPATSMGVFLHNPTAVRYQLHMFNAMYCLVCVI
jgi:hypothetical protein